MVAAEVDKEKAEAENPPDTTHEEIKNMPGFTKLSVHQSDGDDVTNFGFCQVVTNTESVTEPNYTMSGVDKTDEDITSVVTDTNMSTGVIFADIVHGHQSPKSVERFNPVLTVQKNPVTQKKLVARFMLAW